MMIGVQCLRSQVNRMSFPAVPSTSSSQERTKKTRPKNRAACGKQNADVTVTRWRSSTRPPFCGLVFHRSWPLRTGTWRISCDNAPCCVSSADIRLPFSRSRYAYGFGCVEAFVSHRSWDDKFTEAEVTFRDFLFSFPLYCLQYITASAIRVSRQSLTSELNARLSSESHSSALIHLLA